MACRTLRIPASPPGKEVRRMATRRARRRAAAGDTDGPGPLELFLGCLGGWGALSAFFPLLLPTWVGWGLLAGAGLGAVLHLVEGRVEGRSLARSLGVLAVCG